jgi:zinc protease
MRFTRRAYGLLLAAFVSSTFLVSTVEARPLPSDPRIERGSLDNGVTWMYRRHDNPPDRMAFMMHVNTGSLNETDSQRGLAHFMEHMVFNGTEHFPPGALIPFFESIGMEFGPDVNANTSFDRTAYMIFLPSTDLEQIDEALKVLSDYAFRVTLSPEEIDKERPVILEEKRGKKSAAQRIREALWPKLYPGTRFAERIPIGVEEVIASAPRAEFVEYYRTWYRPKNITLIAVGDMASEPVIPLIAKWFGTYKAEVPRRQPGQAGFKPFEKRRAIVLSDPELTSADVQMLTLRPGRPPTVTVEQWRTELVDVIGTWAVARRCDDRVKQGTASFEAAGLRVYDLFNEVLSVRANARGEAAKWAPMLEELIVEIRRARTYGFTEREFDLVRREILAHAERAVRTESTKNGRAIAKEIFDAVNDRIPVLSAEQELRLLKELLPTITPSEISETFARHYAPSTFAYVVTLPENDQVTIPSEDDVLAVVARSWKRSVEPPTTSGPAADLLAELPEPGKVVEETTAEDLGVTSAWLDNGVRVHHRFTDYKKDMVMVSISFAGGTIEETAANRGVSLVAGLAISKPATSRLSSSQIRDLFLGRNMKLGGGPASDDAFVVRLTGSPRDLEFGFQLAHALLTDGVIEPATFDTWKDHELRAIEERKKSVDYQAGEALSGLLSGNDVRRLPVTPEHVEALSIAKGKRWLDRIVRQCACEVAIVGDVPWDVARPLVERYVGSLPKRGRSVEYLEPLRYFDRKTGPLVRHVDVDTVTPKARAYTGFIGTQGRNLADTRALNLAATILTSRLIKRIREELGYVYSISAVNSAAYIYRNAGSFRSGARCDPQNAERVADEVQRVFRAFAEAGPTAEEIDNARKQILKSLETRMKEPTYWMGLLEHLDHRQRSLDEARTAVAAYGAMTAEQVQEVFAKYYVPGNLFTVTAVPAATAAEPVEDAAAAAAN